MLYSSQDMSEDLDTAAMDLGEQCRKLELLINKVSAKTKIVLVVDGLGKVNVESRTAKVFHCL